MSATRSMNGVTRAPFDDGRRLPMRAFLVLS